MSDRAVIFDMDGVLVDSYQAHFVSWSRMAAQRGLVITQEQFAATFGRTTREIIRQLWSDRIDEDDIARMDELKEQIYREILLADFPQMDGAGELLGALSEAGFLLAIGSSGPPQNVQLTLKRLTNAHLIAVTVDGTQVTGGKPDPEVFLTAARKLAIPPSRCAVIEDAPAGIEAARRAGMAAIAITGTTTRKQLNAADLIVDSLRQLTPQAIGELIEQQAK